MMWKNISDIDNGIRKSKDLKMAFINIKNVLRNLKENMNIMESNGRFF